MKRPCKHQNMVHCTAPALQPLDCASRLWLQPHHHRTMVLRVIAHSCIVERSGELEQRSRACGVSGCSLTCPCFKAGAGMQWDKCPTAAAGHYQLFQP
jgi:hypothetical protein